MKKSEKTVKDERPVYILCPRCEINYIDKRDKYCAVCKAEMGIGDPSKIGRASWRERVCQYV